MSQKNGKSTAKTAKLQGIPGRLTEAVLHSIWHPSQSIWQPKQATCTEIPEMFVNQKFPIHKKTSKHFKGKTPQRLTEFLTACYRFTEALSNPQLFCITDKRHAFALLLPHSIPGTFAFELHQLNCSHFTTSLLGWDVWGGGSCANIQLVTPKRW